MNTNEHVTAIEKTRGDTIVALEALVKKSMDENRDFDEAEQAAYDGLKIEVASLDKRLERAKEVQSWVATKAKPAGTEDKAPAGSGARVESNKIKGAVFARTMADLYHAQGNRHVALEIAKGYNDLEAMAVHMAAMPGYHKAAAVAPAATNLAGNVDTLAFTAFGEFIDLLRPATIVGRMSLNRLSFGPGVNSIKMPRRTTGAGSSASFIGEGKPFKVAANAFDSITLTPKKIGIIVLATKEALDRSNPNLEQIIVSDLIAGTSAGVDAHFVSGAASAGVAPGGLSTYPAGAYTKATAGKTLAQITADLVAAKKQLVTVNQNGSLVWLIHPGNIEFMRGLADGNGNYIYRADLEAGRLWGSPFLTSTGVPIDLLLLVDQSEIAYAEDQAIQIEMSTDALVQASTTPTDTLDVTDDGATTVSENIISLFQNDVVGFKVSMRMDWAPRRSSAIFSVTALAYS